MKRRNLALIIIVAVVAIFLVALVLVNNNPPDAPEPQPETQFPLNYTYTVVNTYDHDTSAYTQGLVFDDGVLYEGTGLRGQSTLRQVDLETGDVTQSVSLPDSLFGEGITVFEDKIIQLTWTSKIGFVYNKTTFELIQTFNYTTEQGWGITNNDTFLIMSNGRESSLYFLDPETFQIVDAVEVIDEEPIFNLNELEYINGKVYANVWHQDKIAIINPETGKVEGWIDLTGINEAEKTSDDAVLNGIAYDQASNRLFVTGKLWSKLFEIQLILVE